MQRRAIVERVCPKNSSSVFGLAGQTGVQTEAWLELAPSRLQRWPLSEPETQGFETIG
jgi:hypothetical protein